MNKIDDVLNDILTGGAKKKLTKNKSDTKNNNSKQIKSDSKTKSKKTKPTKQNKSDTKTKSKSKSKSKKNRLSREKNDVFSPRNIKDVRYNVKSNKKFVSVHNDEYISADNDVFLNKPYEEYDKVALKKLEKSKVDIEADRNAQLEEIAM